jgi:hypothetical protein
MLPEIRCLSSVPSECTLTRFGLEIGEVSPLPPAIWNACGCGPMPRCRQDNDCPGPSARLRPPGEDRHGPANIGTRN